MCAIFGFYLNRELNINDINLGKKALKMLEHRGPDDSGVWFNKKKGIFFGHNRLSIIDTSHLNKQPMSYNGTTLIFNGEIYNFKEIKKKFENKFPKFKTLGDTEVLLKLFHFNEKKTLDHLDGMFAFACFKNEKLFLAVDHFGEKPLYYAKMKDGIYFSSEAKPLIELLKLSLTNNKKLKMEFTLFGYINSPNTIYQNLFKLEPAHYIECTTHDKKIRLNKKKYWAVKPRSFSSGAIQPISKDKIENIKEILLTSIESRMISDVPIGLFMSSGIDSILIASLIKKELNQNIDTYTVKFNSAKVHDESTYAKRIAKHLGLNHTIISSDYKKNYNLNNLLELYSLDPNDNLTIFSIFAMSQLARKNIKVALCGMGSDEIFLGYNRYSFFYKYINLIKKLRIFRPTINLIDKLSKNKFKRIQTLNKNFLQVNKRNIYLNHLNRNQLQLYEENLITSISSKYFSGNLNIFLKEMFDYDLKYTMPNSYIPPIDLGSMKASLEVRSPFLNKNLYEYIVKNIDQRSLLKFGSKNILKTILKEYLPEKYLALPKRGFVFPVSELIKKKSTSSEKKIILRKKILEKLNI
ncbi:asparagine synthase (glutamine-hydrolyzing) [Pelagibacterales bacterium SAG-MED50]|nr:asparagine synthase (glutamine-hydrolyzing) [Pelagibacterales bacterium SAG-MED50]